MTDDSKDIIEQELNKAINFLGLNKFSDAESICNEIVKENENSFNELLQNKISPLLIPSLLSDR